MRERQVPMELGVPVAVLEDQHGFLLHHRILWEGSDVDHAVPMIREAQARFPDLRLCSFDRGFHSPRVALDELLDMLPKKGKLSRADREREAETTFREMRQQHPAVESAINNLEQRGMDRVLSYGAAGRGRGRLCADGGAGGLQCPPPAAAQGGPTTTTRRLTGGLPYPYATRSNGNGALGGSGGRSNPKFRRRISQNRHFRAGTSSGCLAAYCRARFS